MSTIIAYKKNGYVHMIADTQVTTGLLKKFNNKSEHNFKIFKGIGLKDTYFCKVGSVYERSLINTFDFNLKDEEVTYDLIVTKVVPSLIERLSLYGKEYTLAKEDIDSTFLIVTKNKIFLLKGNLAIVEINDFVSIGAGSQVVVGALSINDYIDDVKSRLVQAMNITKKVVEGVGGPLVYINTKEEKFEIIKE